MNLRLILILFPIAAVCPAHAAVELNLTHAVKSAMEKNPTVLSARDKLREVESGIPLTRSALFPSVQAGLGAFYKKDPLNIGNPAFGGEPYNFYDFNVKVLQGVYAGGGVSAAISTAKLENRIKELDLAIAERDTQVKVAQAFFGVLLQQRRVETLERSLEFQKWLLTTAQQRYRMGSSRNLEVLQVKTQLALLEPQLAKARNEIQTRATELAQIIGEPNATELRVTGSLEPLRWSEVQAAATSPRDGFAPVASIPELERVRYTQDQAQERRSVTLAKHRPKVDGVFTWGRSSYVQSDLFDEFSTYWQAGIQLSIPIFSGLSSIYERRQLVAAESQLEVEETKLRDQFSLDQIKARKDVELAESLFEAHLSAVRNATDAMKEARSTYRLGTTTYQQLFDSEKSLTEAEFALEQARYDFISAELKYFVASGWKLDTLLQQLAR